MSKDQDAQHGMRVAGSVKELIGKLIGNKEIEDEGARGKSGGFGTLGLGKTPIPDPDKSD